MAAQILNGRSFANLILTNLSQKIQQVSSEALLPKLVILQVKGDEASNIYVRHKLTVAKQIGIIAEHYIFDVDAQYNELAKIINQLNHRTDVHGILLQLPLPMHLDTEKLLMQIDPRKDVDGLTPYNQGLLMQNQPGLKPCTPHGIIRLLMHYDIKLNGKNVVIVNASKLVGKPLAMELLAHKATVTICNSRTQQLEQHIKHADIVVSATGKAHFIHSDWLKKACVVVDVGVHRHPELGLIGDIDFETAKEVASWITPVPGGVGPMTVATLMENVWQAYQQLC